MILMSPRQHHLSVPRPWLLLDRRMKCTNTDYAPVRVLESSRSERHSSMGPFLALLEAHVSAITTSGLLPIGIYDRLYSKYLRLPHSEQRTFR